MAIREMLTTRAIVGLGVMLGLLAIGIVLALIGLLAWLVRRGHLPLGARAVRGGVSIESTVPLGERRSLVIVSVEGRRLMLGLTPMQVSLVTELAPTAKPAFGEALSAAEANASRFRVEGPSGVEGHGSGRNQEPRS